MAMFEACRLQDSLWRLRLRWWSKFEYVLVRDGCEAICSRNLLLVLLFKFVFVLSSVVDKSDWWLLYDACETSHTLLEGVLGQAEWVFRQAKLRVLPVRYQYKRAPS
jgi:hypothetical protein